MQLNLPNTLTSNVQPKDNKAQGSNLKPKDKPQATTSLMEGLGASGWDFKAVTRKVDAYTQLINGQMAVLPEAGEYKGQMTYIGSVSQRGPGGVAQDLNLCIVWINLGNNNFTSIVVSVRGTSADHSDVGLPLAQGEWFDDKCRPKAEFKEQARKHLVKCSIVIDNSSHNPNHRFQKIGLSYKATSV